MSTYQHHKFQGQTVEEMNLFSSLCYSRLKFALDEHNFLISMLREKGFLLNESHLNPKAEQLAEQLYKMNAEGNSLLETLKVHRNALDILFNKQFEEEWKYKHQHRKLMIKIHEFMGDNEDLKKQVFRTLSEAIKHHKQKKLREGNAS